MVNSELVYKNIDKSIKELIKKFKKHPDQFLTEEDVRCFLYSSLIKHPELGTPQKTSDDSYSNLVHAEIRWYGHEDKKLKYRSDIVVIDPTDLQTKNNTFFKVTSKGFSFNDYYAVIELKLRRINGATDNKLLNDKKNGINNDIERLKKIRKNVNQSRHKTVFYSINFDKKTSISDIDSKITNFKNINFYYIPADGDNVLLVNNKIKKLF